jgi:hypothetical protein
LSASAPSSHDLSLAAFTINIAESDFRHTQVNHAGRDDARNEYAQVAIKDAFAAARHQIDA